MTPGRETPRWDFDHTTREGRYYILTSPLHGHPSDSSPPDNMGSLLSCLNGRRGFRALKKEDLEMKECGGTHFPPAGHTTVTSHSGRDSGQPELEVQDGAHKPSVRPVVTASLSGGGMRALLLSLMGVEEEIDPREEARDLKEFREESVIWKLYLEDAEKAANEKAKLWTMEIDSQLIFAGLLAGILSAFVIDIESQLQPDLSDILYFMQHGSINGSPSETSAVVYWVYGLWIVSLFLTLINAAMGVLAKSWVAKYTAPAKGILAKDAYLRFKLERQPVPIPALLLIQIALLLFLIGLVMQSWGNLPSIGGTLLSICLIGAIGYLFMALLPLLVPSFMFNTPLSDLFVHTRHRNVQKRGGPQSGMSGALKHIMFNELIMSGKPTLVDAVVEEVKLNAFKSEWVETLCENDLPELLVSRLRDCAASRATAVVKRDEIIVNYLLVLLSAVQAYEKKSAVEAHKKSSGVDAQVTPSAEPKGFVTTLRNFLKHEESLHHLNSFSTGVRQLLHALRVGILLLDSKSTSTGILDFTHDDLAGMPWELALEEAPSTHGTHFMLSAYRGLWQGEDNLKRISALILCLRLAKVSFPRGGLTEHHVGVDLMKDASICTLVLTGLPKLHEATAILNKSGLQDDAMYLLVGLIESATQILLRSIKQALTTAILPELANREDPSARQTVVKFIMKLSTELRRSASPHSASDLLIYVFTEVIRSKSSDGFDDLVQGGLTTDQARQAIENPPSDPSSMTALKGAMLQRLSNMFDKDSESLLLSLLDLIKHASGTPPVGESRPSWSFPWDRPLDFIEEFIDPHDATATRCRRFAKVVTLATGSTDKSAISSAQQILTLLCTQGSSFCTGLACRIPDLELGVPPQRAEPDAQRVKSVPQSLIVVRWVRLLAMAVHHQPDLRAKVEEALGTIVTSFKETVDTRSAAGGSQTTSQATTGQCGEPASKWDRVLNLLAGYEWSYRLCWLEIFCNISNLYPQEFPDAADLLINIVLRFESYTVFPSEALKGLTSFGSEGLTEPYLQMTLLSHVARLASSCDWKVRVKLPSLLAGFGILPPPADVLNALNVLASNDKHDDVRLEAIKFLSLVRGVDGVSFESVGGSTNNDKAPSLRWYWLESVAPPTNEHAGDPMFPRAASLIDIAIKDNNSIVRSEAASIISRLRRELHEPLQEVEWKLESYRLRNPGLQLPENLVELQNSLALRRDWLVSRIGESIAASIEDKDKDKDKDYYASSASVLVQLTSQKLERDLTQEDPHSFLYPLTRTLAPEHDAWVRLVMLMAKHGIDGVMEDIETAIKNGEYRMVQYVSEELMKAKAELLTQLWTNLSVSRESRGTLGRKTKIADHLEFVNFLTSLFLCENAREPLASTGGVKPPSLIDGVQWATIMPLLVEMCVQEDEEACLRKSALKLLETWLANPQSGGLVRKWSLHMRASLCDQQSPGRQVNAAWVLSELTAGAILRPLGKSGDASLNNLLTPHIPFLLTVLLEKTRPHEAELRNHAATIIKNLSSGTNYDGSTLGEAVLVAIVEGIPQISVEGRQMAVSISNALQVSREKALSIAHTLVTLLRDQGSFQRTLSLQLLSSLIERYQPPLIDSAVREIVALALKDSADDVRIQAIQLLSALASPINGSQKTLPLLPTVELATQFMPLLQIESLRPSVAGFLSAIAGFPKVRGAIALQIAGVSLEPQVHVAFAEGCTELLARLLSDGRFQHTATDKAMIFFASVIVARPELEQYRFEITTALWCHYAASMAVAIQEPSVIQSKQGDQLTGWIAAAIFGKDVDFDKCSEWAADVYEWHQRRTRVTQESILGMVGSQA